MIFCDISKAFDRVWHRGLLFKLKQNGINGLLLDRIENYLSHRTQKVFIGSSMSNLKYTSAGVPQGSVLGPLFFLVYVNDIIDNLLFAYLDYLLMTPRWLLRHQICKI